MQMVIFLRFSKIFKKKKYLVSVQTKEGSKLNPELYQDFKALVVLPEKTFILKNVVNEEEFLRSLMIFTVFFF